MGESDDDLGPDWEGEELVDGDEIAGGAQEEAEVSCPYCGEVSVMGLDPGGGRIQEYVEDCPVCCRPWQVRVHYREAGAAEV